MQTNICKNCGHTDLPPFYDLRKPKRKKYVLKNELYCSVCKSHMETNQDYMTEAENKARQVGLPCLSNDGGTYKNAIGYYTIYVCKHCGKELQ